MRYSRVYGMHRTYRYRETGQIASTNQEPVSPYAGMGSMNNVIVGSDDGVLPGRHQAITLANRRHWFIFILVFQNKYPRNSNNIR